LIKRRSVKYHRKDFDGFEKAELSKFCKSRCREKTAGYRYPPLFVVSVDEIAERHFVVHKVSLLSANAVPKIPVFLFHLVSVFSAIADGFSKSGN